jgi:Mg/Co/Ni transporter MgtE
MALGEIRTGNALRIAWKEARTGIALGLTLGITMAAFIAFILPQMQQSTGSHFDFIHLAMAVSFALTIQVFSATVMGALLPIFARAINLDPAVVSAPSLASTVDISGMMIYFTIVGAVLHLH